MGKLEAGAQAAMLQRFDDLQRKLVPLWKHIGRSDPGSEDLEAPNTIVVLPSMTVDMELEAAAWHAYEQRMLFLLFLLRQPYIRILYLSSSPIAPAIVDYYLDILPSVTASHALERLVLLSPDDSSQGHLVDKLLARPRMIQRIREHIPDLDRAHLVPFLTTDRERQLALEIGIPMYAADPRHFGFGTKSGCRRLFAEEGVAHPIGVENLRDEDALVEAIRGMRATKPELSRLIVKHNEGVSGLGNAGLRLAGLPEPGDAGEADAIRARLRELAFEQADVDYDWYIAKLGDYGGIVEEMIEGRQLLSPSAQLRISPLGEVELLSTHDQMLGGPGGQTYLGARFPADPAYGPAIMREAEKIGRRLAAEGVIGRFAVDFVVVQDEAGRWSPYAIEINLRKGGTTHPFLTLQYLTDGEHDAESGIFRTALGHPKAYVATDTLKSERYKALTPTDLHDLVSEHRLHFDHTSQTGIVLHMYGSIGSLGKLGLTAIADSRDSAEALYVGFIERLDTRCAGRSSPADARE